MPPTPQIGVRLSRHLLDSQLVCISPFYNKIFTAGHHSVDRVPLPAYSNWDTFVLTSAWTPRGSPSRWRFLSSCFWAPRGGEIEGCMQRPPQVGVRETVGLPSSTCPARHLPSGHHQRCVWLCSATSERGGAPRVADVLMEDVWIPGGTPSPDSKPRILIARTSRVPVLRC